MDYYKGIVRSTFDGKVPSKCANVQICRVLNYLHMGNIPRV